MVSTGVKRPGVVTFIGVVLYIQAALAAVAGIVMLAFKDRVNDAINHSSGVTLESNSVVLGAVGELVLAVLLFLVAAGLMRGSRGWRAFVGIVEGLRIVYALFIGLWYHSSAFVESAVVTILIGVFVLWALYGHEKSEEYFEST
jgi:hypothetical protein